MLPNLKNVLNLIKDKVEKTTKIADIELNSSISASELASKLKIEMGKLMYPIGSIYMSIKNTNPSSLFGGTWIAWGSGRVPVGVNTGDADFETVEKTGGAKTHKLTINQIPSHSHDLGVKVTSNNGDSSAEADQIAVNWSSAKHFSEYNGGKTGGSQAHNNLQPYITCYMWKRTA